MSLLPARLRKVHSKTNVLEWPQKISHCKSMQIFMTLKGRYLNKLRLVQLKNSNSSKFRSLSLLHEIMKKIQSKMKALGWKQHYPSILKCSRGVNSIIGDGILMKFKPIQAFIFVLLVCKNEEDPFKILEWSQHFSQYKSMEIFHTLKGS